MGDAIDIKASASFILRKHHPTKSKVEFGCMGQGGCFDDLKIWNAESVK